MKKNKMKKLSKIMKMVNNKEKNLQLMKIYKSIVNVKKIIRKNYRNKKKKRRFNNKKYKEVQKGMKPKPLLIINL